MPKRAPFHKTLSSAVACAGDDAERLGLYGIARGLHRLCFYITYREWRLERENPRRT